MFDAVFFVRGHTGIGVLAPQYGPRRGYFLRVSKKFSELAEIKRCLVKTASAGQLVPFVRLFRRKDTMTLKTTLPRRWTILLEPSRQSTITFKP